MLQLICNFWDFWAWEYGVWLNKLIISDFWSIINECRISPHKRRFCIALIKVLYTGVKSSTVDADSIMQLYHHPYSLDSQKVRLALEEKNIDYTSFHVNPVTGKNFDSNFFRMNPSAKLPVFQNGSVILYNTIEIIQYVLSLFFISFSLIFTITCFVTFLLPF